MYKKEKMQNEEKESKLAIGEVVESLISAEPQELSQEEEIKNFKLKKEKKLYDLSEEELKKREEQEREEEEKLKKQKEELLKSLTVRIPAIEKRIYGQAQNKKDSLKVNTSEEKNVDKTVSKAKEKEAELKNEKNQNKGLERIE